MIPEQLSRQNIDNQLTQCGWLVVDCCDMNITACLGMAVREVSVTTRETDDILYIDSKAAGVLEAKPEGFSLTTAETQSQKYLSGLSTRVPQYRLPLPFEFQQYISPYTNQTFTEEYVVQHLKQNTIDPAANVCITTIQWLYSMRQGEEEFSEENEADSLFETDVDNRKKPLPVIIRTKCQFQDSEDHMPVPFSLVEGTNPKQWNTNLADSRYAHGALRIAVFGANSSRMTVRQ